MKFLSLIILAACVLTSCTSQEKSDYQQAQKAISQGSFRTALDLLDRVVKRNSGTSLTVEAAREAARISYYEVKDYKKAVRFHQFLVLHATDPAERVQSQKQIANIYFDDLQDYGQAIIEISKLLEMPHNDLEESQYRLSLARAYFYLGNYFQALSEIDSLLARRSDETIRFNTLMLKGNILVAQKQHAKAVDIFKKLTLDFPERASKENVGLTLAVSYEESGDFKNAIRILEDFRGKYNPPEYIELRIKRLQERLRNAPGAKGFRK